MEVTRYYRIQLNMSSLRPEANSRVTNLHSISSSFLSSLLAMLDEVGGPYTCVVDPFVNVIGSAV